jgi:hypothetical protein
MTLDPKVLHILTRGSSKEAWDIIIKNAVDITSKQLTEDNASKEITKRDQKIGELDHFLSTTGWDLWQSFGNTVERTSAHLTRWWEAPFTAKAVLILDGLSLRELPWLLQGAKEHCFTIHGITANSSELPGKTNEFAQALNFSNRSQLQNNGGGLKHKLYPAHTDCVDLPWKDCEGLINNDQNWVFWHHWPDNIIHTESVSGRGLDAVTRDAAKQLRSESFWAFIEHLTTGRKLVITSDHGYAATCYFPDADDEVSQFLKKTFASKRNTKGCDDAGPFVPPVALQVKSPHGSHLLALGRRKWKSQGGYPTLTHGGLSLLEVLSPFIELSK